MVASLAERLSVMTNFYPLTAEAIANNTKDGLTWSELNAYLIQHGLDISLVVHDPSREIVNTYYADYGRGLYAHIPLNKQTLYDYDPLLTLALYSKNETVPELAAKDWRKFYTKRVPLPMLIYDFQRRYTTIQPEEVFSVWYSIYSRTGDSIGKWPVEILDYILANARTPKFPELDKDGLITIYRIVERLFTSLEQAIIWNINPKSAFFAAFHDSDNTHIAVAHVQPEQIVAYGLGYEENDVVVRPGAITEYYYEDMIPASIETVISMLAPAFSEFIQFSQQIQKLGYQDEAPFEYHGRTHIQRVLLLALIYFYHSGDSLSDTDRQILIYFSLLHDVGRIDGSYDIAHGARSVSFIHSKGVRIQGLKLLQKDYRIAELLIQWQCCNDSLGKEAIKNASFLSQAEKEHVLHLYHICKDMDGLDRVRFNGLDYRQLRTEYGKNFH